MAALWVGSVAVGFHGMESAIAMRRASHGLETKPLFQAYCSSWFDLGLTAFACSPSELKAAVAKFALAQPGRFRIDVAGRRTGTAPGLVQVPGRPLHAGELVRLSGEPARDEVVVLDAQVDSRDYLFTLSTIEIRPGAEARVRVSNGQPQLILRNMTAKVTVSRMR